MASINLATLIQQTQNQQKQSLSDFQQYINLSTQLKNSIAETENQQMTFLKQVLAAFIAGKQSDLSIPSDTSTASLWKILLANKDYIAQLGAIDLPESGTADERLTALVNYLNLHLTKS